MDEMVPLSWLYFRFQSVEVRGAVVCGSMLRLRLLCAADALVPRCSGGFAWLFTCSMLSENRRPLAVSFRETIGVAPEKDARCGDAVSDVVDLYDLDASALIVGASVLKSM